MGNKWVDVYDIYPFYMVERGEIGVSLFRNYTWLVLVTFMLLTLMFIGYQLTMGDIPRQTYYSFTSEYFNRHIMEESYNQGNIDTVAKTQIFQAANGLGTSANANGVMFSD